MNHLNARLATLLQTNKDKGATAVEYGLIVGLVSLAIIVGAVAMGSSLSDMFNAIATKIGAVTP